MAEHEVKFWQSLEKLKSDRKYEDSENFVVDLADFLGLCVLFELLQGLDIAKSIFVSNCFAIFILLLSAFSGNIMKAGDMEASTIFSGSVPFKPTALLIFNA